MPDCSPTDVDQIPQRLCEGASSLVHSLMTRANGGSNPYMISEGVDRRSPSDYVVELHDRDSGTIYTVDYRNDGGRPATDGFESVSVQRDTGNGMGEIVKISHFPEWAISQERYVTNRYSTDQQGGVTLDYHPSQGQQNTDLINQVDSIVQSIQITV